MRSARQTLGQRGEAFVADYLRRVGYTVVARNWRCLPLGELDIVAQDGLGLVFVEVRTRRGPLADAVQAALESVRSGKQRRLLDLAQAYVAEHEVEGPWRVDVAAVADERGVLAVEMIHDALGW